MDAEAASVPVENLKGVLVTEKSGYTHALRAPTFPAVVPVLRAMPYIVAGDPVVPFLNGPDQPSTPKNALQKTSPIQLRHTEVLLYGAVLEYEDGITTVLLIIATSR